MSTYKHEIMLNENSRQVLETFNFCPKTEKFHVGQKKVQHYEYAIRKNVLCFFLGIKYATLHTYL